MRRCRARAENAHVRPVCVLNEYDDAISARDLRSGPIYVIEKFIRTPPTL